MKRYACFALMIAACAPGTPPPPVDDDTPDLTGPSGDTGAVSVVPGVFALTVPVGDVLTAQQAAGATFAWSESSNAEGYGWSVGRDAACTDIVQQGTTTDLTVTTPTALAPGAYFACVVATNTHGTTAASNNGGGFSVRLDRPATFSIDTRAHQRRSNATLVWTPSSPSATYDVSLGLDAACTDTVFTATSVSGTSVPVPRTDERFGPLFVCVTAIAANGETRAATNDGAPIYIGAFVLGQPDAFTVREMSNLGLQGGANLGGPVGVARVGERLFVVNHDEHAVEVYDTNGTHPARRPLFSLGQPGLFDSDRNGHTALPIAANTLHFPKGVSSDGTRLAVADNVNHRVLIWNTIPTSFAEPADVVLGQADMTSGALEAPSAATLASPESVTFIGSGSNAKLAVADRGTNRVLIWSSVPATNGVNADVVLGQAGFTTSSSACSASTLSAPADVASDGTRLAVADADNHRVLVWNSIPSVSGTAADAILGQPTTTGCSASAPTAQTTAEPRGVAFAANGALFVASYAEHRVLRFDASPDFATGQTAAVVLGQEAFDTANDGGARHELNRPTRLAVINDELFVSDTGNGRVVRFAMAAITGAEALGLLGQFGFANQGTDELRYPAAVASNGARLVIPTYSGNRINVHDSRPNNTAPSPSRVYRPSRGVSDTQVDGLWDATFCGDHVVASDYNNDRLVVFDPSSSDFTVLRVFGQPDLTSNAIPDPPTASSIRDAYSVICVGDRMVYADYGNNRVLIWSSPFGKASTDPDYNGTPADIVLGQDAMNTRAVGTALNRLRGPTSVAVDGDRLFIMDSGNYRVLIFNGFAALTSADNGKTADVVIGYAPADPVPSAEPTASATQFVTAYGLAAANGRLWVNDSGASRMLEFSAIPMTQLPTDAAIAATSVFGQDSLTSDARWRGGAPSDEGLNTPESLSVDDTYLYISDSSDMRVVMLPRD